MERNNEKNNTNHDLFKEYERLLKAMRETEDQLRVLRKQNQYKEEMQARLKNTDFRY